jgi:hypothetical protein
MYVTVFLFDMIPHNKSQHNTTQHCKLIIMYVITFQTMDTTTPTPERLELSVMRLIPDSGGKIEHVTLSDAEVRLQYYLLFIIYFVFYIHVFFCNVSFMCSHNMNIPMRSKVLCIWIASFLLQI